MATHSVPEPSIAIDTHFLMQVEQLIRETAATEVVPRFRNLTAADVAEKSPGDPVTVADRAAEESLTKQLQAILPGSVVVGEERVADDLGVLTLLNGPDPVWIIDPIDGTRNFVAGDPHFATLVALAQHGQLIASWTHGPLVGVTATALAGHGAWADGVQLRITSDPGVLHDLNASAADEPWWPEHIRHGYAQLRKLGVALHPLPACGLDYVEVAAGRRDAMILTWDLPWDHAAGVLLVQEAGGDVRTTDGKPYSLVDGNKLPFVATTGRLTTTALLEAITRESHGCRRSPAEDGTRSKP